ncbi:hypothetical protein FOMPIDRAFT_52639 [Fomitopsis schrenkii]|uniref:MIF4G domain-containing protein n=1 Tax=Fomitopsis schrenkii TaxID=2126942 RepID=S8E5K3_FOMSC|nr:hypothetical protein FOMPIDRAFT_52639 [Fomitopsis schrenkii]
MYARLCEKIVEEISPAVYHDNIRNEEGHPIAGGRLFRMYLIAWCKKDFEGGWTAVTRSQTWLESIGEDSEPTGGSDGTGDIAAAKGQPSSPLAPDHVAQKARQRGLGVARFVGELFRSRVISERVMQECVRKLIGVVEAHPVEEEVERLCALLTTGGPSLESPKALAYMANVFSRLKVLQKRPSLSPRARFMLLDIIEMRKSARTARHTNPTSGGVSLGTPTGRVDGHAATNLSHVRKRSDQSQPQNTMIDGESQAGDNPDLGDSIRGDDASSSGPSRPVRARSANPPQARREGMHSTPAAVMEAHSISSSSSTTLPTSQLPQLIQDSSLANPRHQSLGVDALGGGDFPDDMECPPEYSATLDHPSQIPPVPDAIISSESDGGKDEKACHGCQQSTGEEPKIHLSAEVKQIFVLRDLDKGEAYLRQLPSRQHWRWVHKLVASAVASNSIPDVRLVGDLFYRVVSKNLVLPDAFVAGFTPSLDTLDIVISNTPNAPSLVAIMLKAAQLDSERLAGLVHQVEGSDLDMLIGLLL